MDNGHPYSKSPAPGARLVVLDGLRGLSAMVIVMLHVGGGKWPTHGYLAVDLFFLLSGYVIAGAYEHRLGDGLTAGRFFCARMARLYPLYLFGMTLGAIRVAAMVSPELALKGFAAGLVFAPFKLAVAAVAYGLNGVMWSLALEIAVNILYAAGGFRLTNRALAVIAGASAAGLIALARLKGDADLGSHFSLLDLGGGAARVMFSFPVGVLAWRLHRAGRLPLSGLPQGALVALTIAVYFIGFKSPLVDIALILVIMPLAFFAVLATPQTVGVTATIYGWIGRLSYPLYVVHFPFVDMLPHLAASTTVLSAFRLAPWVLAPTLAMAVFGHWVVEPVGKRLIERLWLAVVRRPVAAKLA